MQWWRLLAWLGAAAILTGPAHAGVLITVDKSAQQMLVSVDGVRRYTWPVSTGRSGYETPSGTFTPFRLEEDHYSKEWDDAPMPHSIFFTREGHAIHGTLEAKRLGSAVSHGCIRLATAHAAQLFALVKETGLGNTKVVVTGSQPPLVAKRGGADRAAAERRQAASEEPVGEPTVIYRPRDPDTYYSYGSYGAPPGYRNPGYRTYPAYRAYPGYYPNGFVYERY